MNNIYNTYIEGTEFTYGLEHSPIYNLPIPNIIHQKIKNMHQEIDFKL